MRDGVEVGCQSSLGSEPRHLSAHEFEFLNHLKNLSCITNFKSLDAHIVCVHYAIMSRETADRDQVTDWATSSDSIPLPHRARTCSAYHRSGKRRRVLPTSLDGRIRMASCSWLEISQTCNVEPFCSRLCGAFTRYLDLKSGCDGCVGYRDDDDGSRLPPGIFPVLRRLEVQHLRLLQASTPGTRT